MSEQPINNFSEFYQFYLKEHSNRTCRALHYIGTSIGLCLFIYLIINKSWYYCFLAFIPGYAFAWIGHFVFEKNRPATFKHPFYSFMADWVMLKDFLIGLINPEKGLPGKLKLLK